MLIVETSDGCKGLLYIHFSVVYVGKYFLRKKKEKAKIISKRTWGVVPTLPRRHLRRTQTHAATTGTCDGPLKNQEGATCILEY